MGLFFHFFLLRTTSVPFTPRSATPHGRKDYWRKEPCPYRPLPSLNDFLSGEDPSYSYGTAFSIHSNQFLHYIIRILFPRGSKVRTKNPTYHFHNIFSDNPFKSFSITLLFLSVLSLGLSLLPSVPNEESKTRDGSYWENLDWSMEDLTVSFL